MVRKISKTLLFNLGILLLLLNIVGFSFLKFGIGIKEVNASPPVSDEWFYSEWQYRKEHNITRSHAEIYLFYDLSNRWTTISGNPTNRHDFNPVHNTAVVEVNIVVDGATRKYLAYDSNNEGSEIRLYYTNNLDGSWTAYSGNPILGPASSRYRWPSVAYINGTFHMFLTDMHDGTLERWTSTNGILYTFGENVKSGGNQWKNPFIWLDGNDNKWYLYSHDTSGGTEQIKVRNASRIEDLDGASDTVVISRTIPFGSPTVMYFGNQYWLLAEILDGGKWKTVAYYSTTSPSSGFKECYNSPILSNDEACPMLVLNPTQTKAYLFANRDSSNWYQDTREVYINRTPLPALEDVTNYQIRITARYASGTDNGEYVYLNGHSRTDFGDVRFTWFNYSSGSEVECDYWIEELKLGDSAQFWVEIPKILSEINNTIYIYYGKNDATTTQNGSNTFTFFDDFNGTLSKWTVIGGTWQIENGELSATTTTYGQRIRANNFIFGNHSVHVKVEWISGTYFEHGPYVRGQSPNEQNNGYMTYLSTWTYDSRHRISKMSGSSEKTLAGEGTTSPSRNVWYTIVFELYGNILASSISPLYSTEITAIDNDFGNGTLSLFDWSASSEHVHFDNLFVCKHVYPEPSHVIWGTEEPNKYVIIDQTFVSDQRADMGSVQAVRFHARWNNNGSDVVGGTIYVNGTAYVTNGTGWVNLSVYSSNVGKDKWVVTGVNCGGVTIYVQTTPDPSIIWDRILIVEGDVTKESVFLGEIVTIWFRALYDYDKDIFDASNGILFVNGQIMVWSTLNNRWEYNYNGTTVGSKAFIISGVYDSSYGLAVINDEIGTQTINVWSSVLSVISNSTISELAFNSTSRVLSFTVSGPNGTIGYTNVTLAKILIEDISELKVYLDGNQINYTAISIDYDYNWLIHFTYQHSTHKVVIILGLPQAESFIKTPLEVAAISEIITILAAILLVIKYRKKLLPINRVRRKDPVVSFITRRITRMKTLLLFLCFSIHSKLDILKT